MEKLQIDRTFILEGTWDNYHYVLKNLNGFTSPPSAEKAILHWTHNSLDGTLAEIVAFIIYEKMMAATIENRQIGFAYNPLENLVYGKVGREITVKVPADTPLHRDTKRLLGPILLSIGVPVQHVSTSLNISVPDLKYPTTPTISAAITHQSGIIYANGINVADSWTPVEDQLLRRLLRPVLPDLGLMLHDQSKMIRSQKTLYQVHHSEEWVERDIGNCTVAGPSEQLDYLERNLEWTATIPEEVRISVTTPDLFKGTVGQCLSVVRFYNDVLQASPQTDEVQCVYNVSADRIQLHVHGQEVARYRIRGVNDRLMRALFKLILPQLGVPLTDRITMTGIPTETTFVPGNGRFRIGLEEGKIAAFINDEVIWTRWKNTKPSTGLHPVLKAIMPTLGYRVTPSGKVKNQPKR
jgi:hypothetical protein